MTTLNDTYPAPAPADKTSLTDDERIENIVPLPPPENLIRFFPIQGTPVERLIADTRGKVRAILQGKSDRLLVPSPSPAARRRPTATASSPLRPSTGRR